MFSEPNQFLRSFLQKGAFILMGASLVVRPLTSGRTAGLETSLLIQLLPLFSALMWTFWMILDKELVFFSSGIELPLAAFILLGWLSVFQASCKLEALATAFNWSADAILFCLVFQIAQHPGLRKRIKSMVLATAVVVALYGLYQRVIHFPELTDYIRQHARATQAMLGFDANNWIDFKSRLATYEVFSTFLIPNALAGYFVAVLPLLLLACWVGWQERGKRPARLGVKLVMAGACLLCLLWTGAKAAWACLPCQVIFFALFARNLVGRRKSMMIAGCAGGAMLLALVLLVAVPVLRPFAYGLWDSLDVRFGYWRSGWAMIRDRAHLVLGAGAGNFKELYPFYKTVGASEVQEAHNHYLQLWCETGLFGLLAFLITWLACFRKCLSKEPVQTPEPLFGEEVSGHLFVFCGLLGFLLAAVYAAPFRNLPTSTDDTALGTILGGLWLALAWRRTSRATEDPADSATSLTRAACLTGIAGLLLHSVVDFDLNVSGCAQVLWALGALALASGGLARKHVFHLNPAGQLILTAVALGCLSFLSLFIFRRLATAEVAKTFGRSFLGKAISDRGVIDPSALERALEQLHVGADANPIDPAVHMDLGLAAQYEWRLTAKREYASIAYRNYRRALELARFRAGFYLRLGEFLELAARREPRFIEELVLSDYATRPGPPAAPRVYVPALVEYAEGARRYASKPSYRLPLADLLWRLRLKEEAGKEYQRIVELDDQINPRWKNLKLAPAERRRAAGRRTKNEE